MTGLRVADNEVALFMLMIFYQIDLFIVQIFGNQNQEEGYHEFDLSQLYKFFGWWIII